MSTRNFGLDLLRTTAIVSVVLFHAAPTLDLPRVVQIASEYGWMGVDLFFVLSGYLIGMQVFFADPGRCAPFLSGCVDFWVKRWTRTLPLYFVVLFVYVVLKPRIFHAPFGGGFDWKWLFFLQNYGDIQDFRSTWSLCIEEQFYLVFPLIALSRRSWPHWIWLVPALFSMAFRLWFATDLADSQSGLVQRVGHDYLTVFRFSTPAMLDSISVGVFLASCRRSWSGWSVHVRLALAGVGLFAWLAVVLFIPTYPTVPLQIAYSYAAIAIAFGAMLIALEQWRAAPRWLAFVHWIAIGSYSTYLLHELVVKIMSRYGQGLHWELRTFVFTLILASVSFASYQVIEKSGMRLRGLLRPQKIPQPVQGQ
jgi:peptidoglycan/LPS O-acetylase OafA/YrhL